MTKVLIVDDEKSIRRTLGEFLRNEGYEVVEAEDAETAQQCLGQSEFDVVVTDIVLPRVSGVELLRRILASAPHVQVVMMTGEPTVETATESLRAGAMDYLFKPITKDAILRVVTHAMRLKSLSDAKRKLELENQAYRENLQQLVQERTAQLQLSEARFRGLVETTFDWVWEVDAEGRYDYVSPKVRELLGYAPEEVLGQTPFDFMPKAEAQRVRGVFREITDKREPFSALQNINLHKNGHQVILETSGVPVFDAAGHYKGYRGMDRDITDRRRLEEQLRQAQKLEAIGQLAGGVAHDFNNILAAIMMQHSLIKMNPTLDEKTREALNDLNHETRRAAELTRQLLMFSRRAVLTVAPIDLGQAVDNLLKMLRRLIGEHIKLELGSRTTLPMVEADAGMIDQVVTNLVVNARDAMPNGGTLTISTALVDFSENQATSSSNRRAGRYVELRVSDTGSGMDAETRQRIFEPFFTTKEAGKGTGLGLATVHGIVAQHKGWVEVESEVGKGSIFRVYLPTITQPAPIIEETPSSEWLPGGTETVLLVEDERALRQATAKGFKALGYTVFAVENGQAALKLWQTHGSQVDLLFTDMVMPGGMTGLQLAQQLKAKKPGLNILISSGYTTEMDKLGAMENEGIHFIPKPCEITKLAEAVRNCLDKRLSQELFKLQGKNHKTGAHQEPTPLTTDSLTAIPAKLKKLMKEAAVAGRYYRLLELNEQIATIDFKISEHLQYLIKKFDYQTIVLLLE